MTSFFDAMYCVKKLANFIPANNCTTSANEPSKCGLRTDYGACQSWLNTQGMEGNQLYDAKNEVKTILGIA